MPRKYEAEIEINGTAEAVWKAIAEAEGVQSWFAPEVRVEPGVGGSIWSSWGPECQGASRIEEWEPNRKLRYAFDRPNERGPNLVEFTIEAREGSKTTLRLVNSGFGDDASFDGELESTSHAWGLFLYLLKHGVETPHTRCRNVSILRMIDIPREEAWKQITAANEINGEQRYFDPYGQVCYELRDMNRSALAIFCEACGKSTMLTVMCLLYDATPEQEESARKIGEAVGERVTASV